MSNLRLSYLQKVGGGDICTGHPPTQKKCGGVYPPIPPGFTPVARAYMEQNKKNPVFDTLNAMRAGW